MSEFMVCYFAIGLIMTTPILADLDLAQMAMEVRGMKIGRLELALMIIVIVMLMWPFMMRR